MADEISVYIIMVTFFIIFGIFLLFDLFGRNEKASYLAYIVAIIPVDFYWGLGYDPLFAYIILFALWSITLLRDTIAVYLKKDKEINEILLYLTLAILIQLIVSAILPEVDESLKDFTEKVGYFYLPNVHSAVFREGVRLGFQLVATLMIILIVVPLILDIKDEEAPLPILIVFVAIFILPFLYLDFIWIGGTDTPVGLLTFLFSVILFIILLLITRSGKEIK
ncbi:MAG: hypothetical protein ACFFFT_14150 [Candidatus Thorarchaeota archaeon]